MSGFIVLLPLLLGAAPQLPSIPAPLGHLGDVVTPATGPDFDRNEKFVLGKLPGCEEAQAVRLDRFMRGSLVALAQVHDALAKTPSTQKLLFGAADVLAAVALRAKQSALAGTAPATLEPFEVHYRASEDPNDAVAIRLVARASGQGNPCRPHLVSTFFDGRKSARFVVDADYAAALDVWVYGNKCQALHIAWDAAGNAFKPQLVRAPLCKR